MKTVVSRFSKETVPVISLLLAVISMFLVPPDGACLGYFDFRTLALLFCLMAVMAGLNRLGLWILIR